MTDLARTSATARNSSYAHTYARSVLDADGYWLDAAAGITWDREPDSGFRMYGDTARWFPGGQLNTSYNALDRHVEAGRGDATALIYDSAMTGTKARFTYRELRDRVARFAGVLRSQGVGKGDRVVIYLPMIPEAIAAMLAVARHGELRRQRLRPGDTPRCIRTGRLVAALELPRGDALRRWRGLLKRLRCLGRGEELDQLDGQPARILGPRAGRTVERIEQAERNRVVPRGQLHLQLQHGGRLQRAVDGNGLHDVAVHTHLHARRFLA